MNSDFCEYCNASLQAVERMVTVYRHRQGRHFIFEQVRARVCSRCGERYFSVDVVREMDQTIRKRKQRFPTAAVPVIVMRRAG